MAGFVATEVSTLGDLLLRAAHHHPDRLALVLPRQRASYAEQREGALRAARALVALGVGRGDHVGILIPNCTEFMETLLGVTLLGAVAVPLNARHKASELCYIIGNAEVVALVTSHHPDDPVDFPALLADSLAAAPPPRLRHRLLARGPAHHGFRDSAEMAALAETVPAETIETMRRRVRLRDPALIIYTSGTTANPKGCVLCHEAVTRGAVERSRYRLKADGVDVTCGGGPLFHIGTLAPYIGSLGVAGTFLSDTHFDAGRALALMEAHGVTLAWPWFAAMVQALIGHADFEAARLPALRHLFLIGPPTLVRQVQQALPQTEIIQACGMTETAGIFALCESHESDDQRATTNGKAAPGIEVRIVDPDSRPDNGLDLPDGTMGEIWVRGYNVMDGYWAAPEKTAEALTPDGWLRTGDLYTRHPGGSLVFGGRCKDMLKVGGENVAAVEVEAYLCTHPAVKTAEVVGRPDPRLDEVPVAFIELNPGMMVDADALIAHCRGQIASYKVPRAVHFVRAEDWPMSATKIDKRALRARLQEMNE